MRLRALIIAASSGAAAMLGAQEVKVTDVGPGAGGRILQEALRRPHRLVEPDTGWFVLERGAQERATVIVLGRTAAIAGTVNGDVIVVDGDLFVRPGGNIEGRAVAIGGGVYPSSLARVAQGSTAFRDNTYEVTRVAGGYQLAYRSLREGESPPLLFPGIYGLRMPTYDRVNGASIPFGPSFSFANGRGLLNGIVAYRSDIGKFDPSIDVDFQATRRMRLHVNAQRGTFSNDAWIWSDFVNSLSALFLGTDTRNYFRADRAELTAHRLWETASTRIEPFVGVRVENAWTVGPTFGETRSPWSVWRRTDSLGMIRPNPQIVDGSLHTALAGGRFEWERDDLRLEARTGVERSLGKMKPDDATLAGLVSTFTQLTSDIDVGFLTFGEQEYGLDVHWVTTSGDAVPQRFAYLGGSGTMPFLDLLEQGGDELLLIDQRYSVPLLNVRLGILGIPTLQVRHRIGSAGFRRLPDLEQVIGLGVMLTVVRAEVQLDPATGRVRFGAGFTFSR